MTTQIRILSDQVISYGPQRVFAGQVMVVEDDSAANWLISQGIAVLDGVDPVTTAPLIDGGAPVNGDPGGELEQDGAQG